MQAWSSYDVVISKYHVIVGLSDLDHYHDDDDYDDDGNGDDDYNSTTVASSVSRPSSSESSSHGHFPSYIRRMYGIFALPEPFPRHAEFATARGTGRLWRTSNYSRLEPCVCYERHFQRHLAT